MQQKFHVSLSTRPPHISCNLFSLCLSYSKSLSIHNKVLLFLQKGYIFLLRTIQNSTKKRINHRSTSLLGEKLSSYRRSLGDKDLQRGGGLWEIQIFLRKSV